jgi:hypothetical protein
MDFKNAFINGCRTLFYLKAELKAERAARRQVLVVVILL